MKNLTKILRPISFVPNWGLMRNFQAHFIKKTFLAGALLLCSLYFSEHANAVQIDWASLASSNAASAVGRPDAVTVNGAAATYNFTGFGLGTGNTSNYSLSSLATFLGVSQGTLAQADFIAFEGNGTPNITFESSRWTFSDGSNSLTVSHTFGNTAAQDTPSGAVLALGNISLSSYQSFFGTPTIPASGDFAYILFDINGVSSVNPGSNSFAVSMVAPGDSAGHPGTPDLDALGRLSVPEPNTFALSAIGLLMFSLGFRYLRKHRVRES